MSGGSDRPRRCQARLLRGRFAVGACPSPAGTLPRHQDGPNGYERVSLAPTADENVGSPEPGPPRIAIEEGDLGATQGFGATDARLGEFSIERLGEQDAGAIVDAP